MSKEALFTSKSDEYSTPSKFIEWLDGYYAFVCDAAARKENNVCKHFYSPRRENSVCKHFYSPSRDALQQDCWGGFGNTFCNPPYSIVSKFIDKAIEQTKDHKGSIVFLVPARTDAKWFHTAMDKATSCLLIKGRLKFGPGETSAPFPSCIITFNRDYYLGINRKRTGCVIKPIELSSKIRGM